MRLLPSDRDGWEFLTSLSHPTSSRVVHKFAIDTHTQVNAEGRQYLKDTHINTECQ